MFTKLEYTMIAGALLAQVDVISQMDWDLTEEQFDEIGARLKLAKQCLDCAQKMDAPKKSPRTTGKEKTA